MLESLKGYRTVLFNLLMTVIMVLSLWKPGEAWPGAEAINSFLDSFEVAFAFLWGLGNMILRAVTDTPIFKK
jgi:hypothetical protein